MGPIQSIRTGARRGTLTASSRRKAGRPSGTGSDEVRIGCKPQDGQGARSFCAAVDPIARRRGDRMRAAMSAIGPKRTSKQNLLRKLICVLLIVINDDLGNELYIAV